MYIYVINIYDGFVAVGKTVTWWIVHLLVIFSVEERSSYEGQVQFYLRKLFMHYDLFWFIYNFQKENGRL